MNILKFHGKNEKLVIRLLELKRRDKDLVRKMIANRDRVERVENRIESIKDRMIASREQSFKNLVNIKNIFESLGITYWIEHGLLLGLYREGDIIGGDEDDVDIGVPKSDAHKLTEALPLLKKIGFIKKVGSSDKDKDYSSMALKRGTRVDIHVLYKKEDIVYFPMFKKSADEVGVFVYPAKLFDGLGKITWMGIEFPCPNNVKEYLVVRYGKDWHINKIENGEWNGPRDLTLNPCLKMWPMSDLNI